MPLLLILQPEKRFMPGGLTPVSMGHKSADNIQLLIENLPGLVVRITSPDMEPIPNLAGNLRLEARKDYDISDLCADMMQLKNRIGTDPIDVIITGYPSPQGILLLALACRGVFNSVTVVMDACDSPAYPAACPQGKDCPIVDGAMMHRSAMAACASLDGVTVRTSGEVLSRWVA